MKNAEGVSEVGIFVVAVLVCVLIIGLALCFRDREERLQELRHSPAKAWSLYQEAQEYELQRHKEATGK